MEILHHLPAGHFRDGDVGYAIWRTVSVNNLLLQTSSGSVTFRGQELFLRNSTCTTADGSRIQVAMLLDLNAARRLVGGAGQGSGAHATCCCKWQCVSDICCRCSCPTECAALAAVENHTKEVGILLAAIVAWEESKQAKTKEGCFQYWARQKDCDEKQKKVLDDAAKALQMIRSESSGEGKEAVA